MNIQDHITKFNKKFCIDTFLTDRKRYAGNLRITEWLESALTSYAKQERDKQKELDAEIVKRWHIKKGGFTSLEHAIRNQKDHD